MNQQERPLFVQPHLVKEGDEVRLWIDACICTWSAAAGFRFR